MGIQFMKLHARHYVRWLEERHYTSAERGFLASPPEFLDVVDKILERFSLPDYEPLRHLASYSNVT